MLFIELKNDSKNLILNEAYYRMKDVLITLLSITLDLDECGIGSQQCSQIFNLLSQLLNSSFSFQCLHPKSNAKVSEKKKIRKEPITKKLLKQCAPPTQPITTFYSNLRKINNNGSERIQLPCERVKNGGGLPKYHYTGACLLFNLYLHYARNINKCNDYSMEHKSTHFCLLCFDKDHGLMFCPWIRGTLSKSKKVERDISKVNVMNELTWKYKSKKQWQQEKENREKKESEATITTNTKSTSKKT